MSTAEHLRRILGYEDTDCERLLARAAQLFASGELERAEVIATGLAVMTDDLRPSKLLGAILMLRHEHVAAAKVFERIIAAGGEDPFVLVALAEIELRSLKLERAIPLFERLFALDPNGEHPAANRGRMLVRQHVDQLSG